MLELSYGCISVAVIWAMTRFSETLDVGDLKPALIKKRGKPDGGTWDHPDLAILYLKNKPVLK